MDPTDETCAALERDTIPGFTYKDLSTIKPKEWVDMQSRGLDSSKLGEGKIGDITYEEHVFQLLCTRVKALERKEEKEAQHEEEADQHAPVSTALPERISHSIDRIVSAQAPISMATSHENPSAQVDVPTIERPQGEPSIETEEGGGTDAQQGTEVQLPAQMEAGRQESIVEDLHPSNDHPPNKPQSRPMIEEGSKSPRTKGPARENQAPKDQPRAVDKQRSTRTGYSLRHAPPKARPKDL
jgi:hypothetical protein